MTDEPLKLTLRRRLSAPRERVFALWTESPADPFDWWGPEGFTFVRRETDLRPGGEWRLIMRAPSGSTHTNGGVYREVKRPERLVMTHCWFDDADRATSPETVIAITLTEVDGDTDMLFEQTGFETLAARDSHEGGWSEAFAALAGAAAKLRQAA